MSRWPWVVFIASSLSAIVLLVIWPEGLTPWLLPSFSALVVGTYITSKAPKNPIGKLLMTFALVAAISGTAYLPFTGADQVVRGWVEAITSGFNTASLPLLVLLLLRFPDGERLSERWVLAEWYTFLVMIVGFTSAFLNGGWGGDITQGAAVSPLRDSTRPVSTALPDIFFPLLGASFLLAVISIVIRFRRSSGVRRQQMKWLAYAVVVLMAVISSTGFQGEASPWEIYVLPIAFTLPPIAIGIAVLRHGLFEIDLVISRTLVFGAVAAFITGIYALLVVGVGQWIGVGSSNVVLSVASTAIVALLFEPFRVRAQRLANRLVYGTRATPYEVLSDLTVRLSEAESLEGLLDRMARRLADGTGAQSAVVWALDGDDYLPVAGWPERPTEPKSSLDRIPGETVAVAHDGDPMGALSVVKPRGELLTSTEIALLDDLAGSAGLVMGKLRLDAALAARAHELADSRRRLVTAQDVERRRLERDLHDGAQQLVVSLKVKLGIASQVARSEDGGEVADLLDTLAGDAQLAIDEIRSLARGIFPPLLESEGLKSAVGSLAASSGTDVELDVQDPGTLPRDVESAVYFCISEALTNAGKHAPGSPVEISVARDDQRLSFSVADRGPGMAASNGAAGGGSGLRNMRDRVEALGGTIAIEERQGGGVEVRGELTVEPDLATV